MQLVKVTLFFVCLFSSYIVKIMTSHQHNVTQTTNYMKTLTTNLFRLLRCFNKKQLFCVILWSCLVTSIVLNIEVYHVVYVLGYKQHHYYSGRNIRQIMLRETMTIHMMSVCLFVCLFVCLWVCFLYLKMFSLFMNPVPSCLCL